MLIFLFLFSLFRHLQSAPLTADNGGSITNNLPALHNLPRAEIVFGTRSTCNIVTNCLATIFACTWTVIHPNIPSPADSRWNIFKQRVVTTIYALLAPEFISLWAFRQYLGAKRIKQEYNRDIANRHGLGLKDTPQQPWYKQPWGVFKEWLFCAPPFYPTKEGEIHPWTTSHGFFVQMGGFVLAQNGRPMQAMSFSKSWFERDDKISAYISKHKGQRNPCDGIKEFILSGVIDTPKITKAEIDDRSKGDIISKFVVILQTTWFISQCIARWSARIPVTELEIVTLGFAILNGITYALWWHKPQDVGVPVYLEFKAQLLANSLDNGGPIPESKIVEIKLGRQLPEVSSEASSNNQTTEESDQLVSKQLIDMKHDQPSFLPRKFKEDWDSSTCRKLVLLIPFRLIGGALRPLGKLSNASYNYICEGDLRVPVFFAEPLTNTNNIGTFVAVVATPFGCVHLIPSFFLHYASPTEMWLWQISAAFITIQPCFYALFIYGRTLEKYIPYWFLRPILVIVFASLPLYIVARLALIVLSFLALRDLPVDAHQTIDWISSIPHL